jgi:hypothetical protein
MLQHFRPVLIKVLINRAGSDGPRNQCYNRRKDGSRAMNVCAISRAIVDEHCSNSR